MTLCAKKNLADKKSEGFIRRNMFLILAFLVPALIIAVVFALRSFFPFGNRMVMVSDGWHQYYPFLSEYQQMLKEGRSLMYSWNVGGGVNFSGVMANYVGSPWYLLTAIIPSGTPWLPLFLAVTVILRIGCAGLFFGVFLHKTFRRKDISVSAFGTMYALCAFALGYYWNTMWLDTFALMPLVIAGVVGVLRDKKFILYIISLTLSVLFSFYIGYMVCLFVLLFSICYTIVSFISMKESLKNAGKMVLYTGIAFMMTAVVTIPAFMALNGSDSAGSAEGFPAQYTINYAYNLDNNDIISTLLAFARTATNMISADNPIKMDQGDPNIACGMLALALVPFYFFTKKIKLKEKLVSIILLVFLLAGFVVNQLNYIWHAFATPAMVYYRWSFIFSFAVLVLAYRAFTLLDSFGTKTIIASSALLILYFGAAFFLQRKLSVLATAAGVALIMILIVLYKREKVKYRTLSLLLTLVVVCDMAVTAYVGVRFVGSTKMENYPMNEKSVESLIDTAYEESKGEMFRTEFLAPQTLNDGALNSVWGITTFNSMVDSSYADTLKELGLSASMPNNRYAYYETSPVANIFLNIKYLIGREYQTKDENENDVTKVQKALDTAYLKEVAKAENCTLYENTAYVPMGFMAQKELLTYKKSASWRLPAEILNEMFSKATGIAPDVFIEVEPLEEISVEYKDKLSRRGVDPHSYSYQLTDVKSPDGEETTLMTVEYEIPKDGSYYGVFRSTTDKKTKIIINGDEENSFEMDQTYTCMPSVGTLKAGDKVRVEMEAEYGKKATIAYRMVRINDYVLQKGAEKLRQSTMELSQWNDTSVKGTINVKESGLFYTSVLYCDGWKAYVDGKEVEITPVGDTFIAFELAEGKHDISLEYESPGIKAGVIISIMGVAAFVLLCAGSVLIGKKKKSTPCSAEAIDTESLQTDESVEDSAPSDAE